MFRLGSGRGVRDVGSDRDLSWFESSLSTKYETL
jgi:hypothetical protein